MTYITRRQAVAPLNKEVPINNTDLALTEAYKELDEIINNHDINSDTDFDFNGLKLTAEELEALNDPEINAMAQEYRESRKTNKIQEVLKKIVGLCRVNNPEDLVGLDIERAFQHFLDIQNGLETLGVQTRKRINEKLVDTNGSPSLDVTIIEEAESVLTTLENGYNILSEKLNEAKDNIVAASNSNVGHPSITQAAKIVRAPYLEQAQNFLDSYQSALTEGLLLLEDARENLKTDRENYISVYNKLSTLIELGNNAVEAVNEGLDVAEYTEMVARFRKTVQGIVYDTYIVFSDALLLKRRNGFPSKMRTGIPAE